MSAEIDLARIDGLKAGRAHIKLAGLSEAKAYAKQLGDEYPNPSPQMYGYIDGFMNACVEAMP